MFHIYILAKSCIFIYPNEMHTYFFFDQAYEVVLTSDTCFNHFRKGGQHRHVLDVTFCQFTNETLVPGLQAK